MVTGLLKGRRVIGLRGHDQDGPYVILLKGDEEGGASIANLNLFEGSLSIIHGEVSAGPTKLSDAYGLKRVGPDHGGALLVASDGSLGISIRYRQGPGREEIFRYDLNSGEPWAHDKSFIAFGDWSLFVKSSPTSPPVEIAKFAATQ